MDVSGQGLRPDLFDSLLECLLFGMRHHDAIVAKCVARN
jgi:hypothetical protein